jgi:hypothetical protein
MSTDKNKPIPAKPAAKPQAARAPQHELGLWWRLLISLFVVWHLFVVFIAPMSVPPTSSTVEYLARMSPVRWYGDPLYLNHGYHFFAPDPVVNAVVRYQILDSGGQKTSEGEFPSLKSQWPRLFYHRHMMLSDQADTPIDPTGRMNREQTLRVTLTAYARHLLRISPGERIDLQYLRHNVLLPGDVLQNVDPNDPRTFAEEVRVSVTRRDLEAPLPGLPTIAETPPAEPIPEPAGGQR